MSRYEHDFTHMFAGLEKQIAETDNPRHRAILKNYRLHGLLEVSGRYEELLSPTMTVEHPHYRIHEGGQSTILDGMAEVRAFYRSLVEANALVMWVAEQDIAVNDHGFSGEVVFNEFVPAPMLEGSAFGNIQAGEDPSEIYLLKRTLAFVWPYDEQCRMDRRTRLRGRRLPRDQQAGPRRRHHGGTRRGTARPRDRQGTSLTGRFRTADRPHGSDRSPSTR